MTTIRCLPNTDSATRHGRLRPLPWPLRWITYIVITIQFCLPIIPAALNAAETIPAQTQPVASNFAVPPPMPVVTVNRTVSDVKSPTTELVFSANPADEEIAHARVFQTPIVTVGKVADPGENSDLATALVAFRSRQDSDDASAIENFLKLHPSSPRNISLKANLAEHYRHTSQFSKAVDAYQQVWALGKNVTDLNGHQVVDQAIGDWASLLVTLGRAGDLKNLILELNGRDLYGAAAVRIADAKSALWQMEHLPNRTFRCGPYSLYRIQAAIDPTAPLNKEFLNEDSATNGTSLYQNWQLSQRMGLKYQMAKRQNGAAVPLPVVVHWKLKHFSALTKMQDGLYMIEDPTFRQGWISPKILDEESDGYFLIPDGSLPDGWSAVGEDEGKTVFGQSAPTGGDVGAGGGDCAAAPPGAGGFKEGGPGTNPCGGKKGMPQYAFNMMRIGLELEDVPVGYTPPRGQEIEFRVKYSERTIYESGPFTHANMGNQWTFGWLTYVTDDTTQTNANIHVIEGGGNSLTFAGYNPTTQSYAVETYLQGQMTRTSGSSYQCVYPDGSMEIFSQPDNTNGPRHVFLTQKKDPAGNTLNFTYDSTNRLVSVTDAIGQVTTVSYALTTDIYKITKVADPFGRYATFNYNGSGQLTNITDEIGISTTFAYNSGGGEADFVNSMTTPYGTTTFTNNFSSTNDFQRWLLATDPLGGQERAEAAIPVDYGPATGPIPSGINTNLIDYELTQRMSFFWNKATMLAMQGNIDYHKARQYVWDGTYANYYTWSRTLGSIKQPLENARIWFNYPGQTNADQEGIISAPTAIARVLDDGTTQLQQYQYNAIGKPVQAIDPSGRTTLFTYSTNNIDLLSVGHLCAGATNFLAKYNYNPQHLPLTKVDAAGNTNFFGYNTNGQLTALTNALSQVVTLGYNTNGYLTSIGGPLGITNSFTYDGYGRVHTVTDSEGYAITTSYDNLDRPTNITYMDGTYEQIVYNALDPALHRDRDGHWTSLTYDSLRHLTDVYDGLGRHTELNWCTCGALASIVDPNGNVTAWIRDIQNRVTQKIYPDLTTITYNYETNKSRLLSVTDAKNQTTRYNYFMDNNVRQVSFSNAVVTPSVMFAYDTNYNRLITMIDGVGTNTYAYYTVTNGQLGAGMLASVSNSFSGSYVIYNYDALGRVTNRAINNVAEQLTYDALGRLTVITNALGIFTNMYLRATALVTTNFTPFGITTVFNYMGVTNDERLQTIWNQRTNGVTLSKFDYSYDPLGQITNWTQQADSTVTNVEVIQYDPVNQLLTVTVHNNTVAGAILNQYAYGYDTAGNRTTEQISSGNAGPVGMSQSSYNANNQLTSRAGATGSMLFAGSISKQAMVTVAGKSATINHQTTNFTGYSSVTNGTNTIPIVANDYNGNSATNKYQVVVTNNGVAKTIAFDLNGNETSVVTATSTNSYQWDAANRLVSITGSTNQSLFSYDGFGRRVQIVEMTNGVAASTNKYVWCGFDICEQRNSAGAVSKRYFNEGEQISGLNYFFTKDHLGSIREMLDSGGTIQARYSYDPYGRRTKISGSLDADFGFTGQYYHVPSGLCLAAFREYDPDLGRWLSRDPIAEMGGLNLYAYVINDPVNLTDFYGTCGAGGEVASQGLAAHSLFNNASSLASNFNATASAYNNAISNNNAMANASDFESLYNEANYATNMANLLSGIGKTAEPAVYIVDPPIGKLHSLADGLQKSGDVVQNLKNASSPYPPNHWFYDGSQDLSNFHASVNIQRTSLPNGATQTIFSGMNSCN